MVGARRQVCWWGRQEALVLVQRRRWDLCGH